MPHAISTHTKQRIYNTFLDLGGVDLTNAEIAARVGYHTTIVGSVMKETEKNGLTTRRRLTGQGKGHPPFAYTAVVNDGPQAARVDVDLPQEVESKPEPEELVEATSTSRPYVLRGRKTATFRVASLLNSTYDVGRCFTIPAVHNAVNRAKGRDHTREAVSQAVHTLMNHGYIEVMDKPAKRGGVIVPKYRIVKSLDTLFTGSKAKAVKPVKTRAQSSAAPQQGDAFGVVATLDSLAAARTEAEAAVANLTDQLEGAQAHLATVTAAIEATKARALSL